MSIILIKVANISSPDLPFPQPEVARINVGDYELEIDPAQNSPALIRQPQDQVHTNKRSTAMPFTIGKSCAIKHFFARSASLTVRAVAELHAIPRIWTLHFLRLS